MIILTTITTVILLFIPRTVLTSPRCTSGYLITQKEGRSRIKVRGATVEKLEERGGRKGGQRRKIVKTGRTRRMFGQREERERVDLVS